MWIYVYRFICKQCGNESKTSQSLPSRKSILKGASSNVTLRCRKCDSFNDYHVNRVYRNLNPIFGVLLTLIVFVGSYLFGNYMKEEYWRDDYRVVNDSIVIIVFSYMLPLVIGLFILIKLAVPQGTMSD